jgi:DNA-directed RNA polymerase subunit L
MEPKVVSIGTNGGELNFELVDTELSIVNSLRRVMITNIDSLVFRGFPHKENLIKISKNNSKFNNEYLKHRIQCIPIHYDDESNFDAMIKQYDVRLNVANDTNNIRYVTTRDFVIYNKGTGQPITSASNISVRTMFPPDKISNNYIPICCLMPKISEGDEIEELSLIIDFSIGNSKEDSCWNMVSKCCYENKRDTQAIEKYLKKDKEAVAKYHKNDPVAIDTYMKSTMNPEEELDFRILDAQRIYIENSYIMKVESVGVFTNEEIVKKACEYLLFRLNEFTDFLKEAVIEKVVTKEKFCLYVDTTTIKPTFCLYIQNDDYTIGKIIEKYLYLMFKSEIFYVSFKKEHPHDTHCLVSFTYNDDVTSEIILDNLRMVASELIRVYEIISSKFQ